MAAVALCGITLAAYIPALGCGFGWDDDDYVTENATLRTPNGLRRIWLEPRATPQYYPVVHTTFWIEYHLWGLKPAGYHLVNVLIHAGNAVLVWLVLRKLSIPGAWLAAAVFGLHPVHVESVAWVTERKNVLSGMLYLGSLLVYADIAGIGTRPAAGPRAAPGRGTFWQRFCSWARLLSKSVTCSLPAAILLLIALKRRLAWRDVRPLVPWFVLGLATAWITVILEKTHVGAAGSPFAWSFSDRCLIAGRALWFYFGKLAWPHPLTFMYPRWQVADDDPSQWAYVAMCVATLVFCFAMRRRWGLGPLVAALFFAGTLLPALGFINVYPMRYSFVADHFQYLASLGPITIGAAAWAMWSVNPLKKGPLKKGTVPVGRVDLLQQGHSPERDSPLFQQAGSGALNRLLTVLVLATLAALTWHQQRIYRNAETLWTDVLARNPQSSAAHFHLGKIRTSQGKTWEATQHFRAALDGQTDTTELAIIQTLLANSLAREGQIEQGARGLCTGVTRKPEFLGGG